MGNEKNIEKATRQEPRSVLLIDGRGEGDAPMDGWTGLLNVAYSKIAPVDDGISHLDIDVVKYTRLKSCASFGGKHNRRA